MQLFYGVVGVIAGVGGRPAIGRRPGSPNYVLVDVVVRVTVTVVNAGVVIEMVVAAEIRSPAGISYAGPESVTLRRVIIEAIRVQRSESWFVACNEDMLGGVCRQLIVEPLLVYLVNGAMLDAGILIEQDDKSVLMRDRVGHILFADRPVIAQHVLGIEVIAEDVEPSRGEVVVRVQVGVSVSTPSVSNLMVAATDIDADVVISDRFHFLQPDSDLGFELSRFTRRVT